jgi:hypothetical protein
MPLPCTAVTSSGVAEKLKRRRKYCTWARVGDAVGAAIGEIAGGAATATDVNIEVPSNAPANMARTVCLITLSPLNAITLK